MTTFARPSLLDNRYAAIAETSAYTYDDDDLVNYADFLRKHGRYMTKGGYVDSSRRIRSLHRQQDDPISSSAGVGGSKLPGLLASFGKHATSRSADISPRQRLKTDGQSVIAISANLENKKKEFDKQMRLIEEQMIKAKQVERETKRQEGDIKKEQRSLHHTLRELDVDATRKRFDAEKNLSKNLEEKDKIEREFVKKREQQTKQRTERAVDTLQATKDKDRKNLLMCNDLARQYRTKINQLDIKHKELSRLHLDFEQKVQSKEIEENRIKKELGEIALALNMEAQKAKTDLKEFQHQTSVHVKNYDLERRRLSGDITLHKSLLDLKQREGTHAHRLLLQECGEHLVDMKELVHEYYRNHYTPIILRKLLLHHTLRRIVDTKNRLENIYAKQRELNKTAIVAEQDRRAIELMTKVEDVSNRRNQLMSQYLRDKTEKSEEKELLGSEKAKVRYIEIETRQHEDHLKHFQKVLNKNEEQEHDLYKSVKEAESGRRKKEQDVKKLQDELVKTKRVHAEKIKQEISKAEKAERELEQQLIKEKSKLDKLHAKREDSYLRLLRQRGQIRENKSLLETHEKEHERLLRVQARSQSMQSLNTI
ncbi:unnamed protein product [Didymodactylos carnosus]|uniref:Uncharacterized protein n=1 Tax=Didymodactylos carnosus TaxID=1234261 RepID=A0A813UEK2_9BILA|nr:unnamed protein product [Didymodactylos carnosus]CAF3609214.1 unnamed protein product [Didymodactylos carnosus]